MLVQQIGKLTSNEDGKNETVYMIVTMPTGTKKRKTCPEEKENPEEKLS
jgi:hypothetical protein